MTVNVLIPTFFDGKIMWPPSNRPISTTLVEEAIDSSNFDAIFVAPSILEELTQSPESIKRLEKLDIVAFGGGGSNDVAI